MPTHIYVSRLMKSTTVEDMQAYVKSMGEECLDIQVLNQKYETTFNSFKIIVPRSKLSIFLNNNFWPEGVKYRIFKERNVKKGFMNNKL